LRPKLSNGTIVDKESASRQTATVFRTELPQVFSATALDQFGEPLAVQPAIAWSLDAPSVGMVDSSGLYAAPTSNIGSATVRATSALASGSATVAVAWLKGDLDGDGALGVPDITGLVTALADLPKYQTSHGLTSDNVLAIADIDGNQPITNLDLQSLINLLANAAPTGGGATLALQQPAASGVLAAAKPTFATTSGLITPVELLASSNTADTNPSGGRTSKPYNTGIAPPAATPSNLALERQSHWPSITSSRP
jgi:hypothetical protein